MEQETFQISDALRVLAFEFEDADISSVYFVDKLSSYIDNNAYSPYVITGLEEARNFEADAVYFRMMDNGQPPMPQIFIYDNVTHRRSERDFARIHRNIWSAAVIPLYFVLDRHQISVFDGRVPVEVSSSGSLEVQPVREIPLTEVNEAVALYQAEQFSSGDFWEGQEAANNYRASQAVDVKLLSSLKVVRQHLRTRCNLDAPLADRLLVVCILIKYLEENGTADEEEGNLAREFFLRSVQAGSLVEAIEKGKFPDLLDSLAEHFNGGVFRMGDADKTAIRNADLTFLASFLAGKLIEGRQLVLWEEYSFKYIPIELISNFYEQFLPIDEKTMKKEDTSAVYTPSHLVKLLVDENLPLDGGFKRTIDVSCGSGIFLVTAFRRMVQMWRYQHRTNGKLADADEEDLQHLLREYIFGVDINPTATELTIFSLNLALCSMLSPRQIWTRLRFDNLGAKNILNQDFFDYFIANDKRFDLVIGNPPFKEYKNTAYSQIASKLKANDTAFCGAIARHQAALMFLDRAMTMLKANGRLCLILPAAPFLHSSKQEAFRRDFFSRYNVVQIIDFTFLKALLFKGVNIATIALFADNKQPDEKSITHIVAKRTGASKEGTFFEFDYYDFFDVPKQLAQTDRRIWKSNLLGGAMIYNTVERYGRRQTMKEFLDSHAWDYGVGYTIGNKTKQADYITGKQVIIDKSFKEDGSWETRMEDSDRFEGPRKKELYMPPHLLIKRSIGKQQFPMRLSQDYIPFREGIIGIHCPRQEKKELECLERYIRKNNNLLRLMIVAGSSRAGITKSVYTHYIEDFLRLPYDTDLRFSKNEEIIAEDVAKYVFPYFDNTRSPMTDETAGHKALQDFGTLYCERMNLIYGQESQKYVPSGYYEGENYFIYVFEYTRHCPTFHRSTSKADFSALLNLRTEDYIVKRVARIYDGSRIVMIKPKLLRYWLKSIALRDANDTLHDALDYWIHEH